MFYPKTDILTKALTYKTTADIQCLSHTRQHKYKTCSRTLDKTCINSTLVAVKVIRYPIYGVHELLRILPDLKVIYYVRDPRGIIASRAAVHGWSRGNLASNARYLCLQMVKNLTTFKTLRNQHPKQLINYRIL